MSTLTYDNNALLYVSRYTPELVAELKTRIPATERQWDGSRKAWRVAPKHAMLLCDLTQQYLGESLTPPNVAAVTNVTESRVLDIRYVGMTKDRGNGERSAFGYCNASWSVVFSEPVLRKWFGAGDMRPNELPTLYATLGVTDSVDEGALKTAYRRLARQWHPDVCREPDATQQFQRIQHAYSLLSDAHVRAKYDAGLRLQASIKTSDTPALLSNGYRAPLRCGLLLAEGQPLLVRFVVSDILAWEDITDWAGRVLVTSWPSNADMFVEAWQ